MALQESVAVRNGRLNSIETTIGTAPLLQVRTGGAPANCAAADSGTLLVEMTLPVDWMADALTGAKAKAGTWSGTAIADGAAAHFRIKDSTGVTCHMQGTCGQGSGDMSLDNTNIATGQTVSVSSFSITAANA